MRLPDLFPPADVPAPADALLWHDWTEHDVCEWQRYFNVSERHIDGGNGGVTVSVGGLQHHSGVVTDRWVHVCGDGELSADGLRVLAQACLDAAAHLDMES